MAAMSIVFCVSWDCVKTKNNIVVKHHCIKKYQQRVKQKREKKHLGPKLKLLDDNAVYQWLE